MLNPDFISRISPFRSLRFIDWMETLYSFQTNWSDRPTQNWVFWNDGLKFNNAGNPSGGAGIVPAEVMFALCNKINADCWFNMPLLSTDDYVNQLATLAHSMLNNNLKVCVEYGNDIWNPGALNPTLWRDIIADGYAALPGVSRDFGAGFFYAVIPA